MGGGGGGVWGCVQQRYDSSHCSTYRGWELKGSLVSLDFAPGPSFTAEPSLEAILNKNKNTTKAYIQQQQQQKNVSTWYVMWGGGGERIDMTM